MGAREEAPKAYRLFLDETSKHILCLLEFVHEASSAPPGKLSDDGTWREKLKEAARRAHTIKGGAGFFALDTILSQARHVESVLSHDPTVATVLLLQPELENMKSDILTLQAQATLSQADDMPGD